MGKGINKNNWFGFLIFIVNSRKNIKNYLFIVYIKNIKNYLPKRLVLDYFCDIYIRTKFVK